VERLRWVTAHRHRGARPLAASAAAGRGPAGHADRGGRRTHPRLADTPARAHAIKTAAAGWAHFWTGRLDLDALAFDVTEHLTDLATAQARIDRATEQARAYCERLFGDDELLLSLPGMGPVTAPTVRAFFGDGTGFGAAKHAASYVGLTPSTWSSGTVHQPHWAISKEGPAVLRLAFYQAGNVARGLNPQLAAFYRQLMVDRGHCHTQATVAVARKLVERTWTARRVGEDGHDVAAVAVEYGVGWHTIMRGGARPRQPLVEDPARLGGVGAVGVDETPAHAGL
jgi:Transposase IS116/IS110/IS902 family